jgi:two-component system phosphate regulon sensor histidine kinase PhoR/two-component system sensor histidine kinase VicK
MDLSRTEQHRERLMAVEKAKRPSMVRDYWPRYRRRSIFITIILQIAATSAVGGALAVTGVVNITPLFWVIIIAVLTTSVGVNIMLMTILMQPLKDLTSALTHISGEPTIVTPPNPNAAHFEREGFKPVLQLIYELAAARPESIAGETTPAPTNAAADFMKTALDNSAAGFIVLNHDGDVSYANSIAPIRVTPDGKQVLDLLFDESNNFDTWLADCREHAVRAEKTWQRIPNKIVGEEDRKIYDVTASYQKGSGAEIVLSLFDRSNVYQPEDDDLDFIAFAAHELRGPITVIRGYLDVLGDELDGKLAADQVELMKRLVVSANRLSSYINNILNASRYDRRHLKVHLEETTMADIYDSIRDDMQLRATSQNRALAVDIPANLPTIAADRGSLSEVMSNLIDNALKYSNEGGLVNVTATADASSVSFIVTDHGIGMPGNVVSNLFHKFYRSHRSRETVAGTGIGLYISKAITESHGGTIGVKSAEGEGSTFSVTLPLYSMVAEKLQAAHNSNEQLIERQEGGWIKNHAMYRG